MGNGEEPSITFMRSKSMDFISWHAPLSNPQYSMSHCLWQQFLPAFRAVKRKKIRKNIKLQPLIFEFFIGICYSRSAQLVGLVAPPHSHGCRSQDNIYIIYPGKNNNAMILEFRSCLRNMYKLGLCFFFFTII
jgi:hypothetical protein